MWLWNQTTSGFLYIHGTLQHIQRASRSALESESENKVLLSQLEEIILLESLVLSRGAQKLLPQRLLWKAMLATRKWTTESEYFGQKLEIETPMEQLPSNLKRKILHVANTRKSKKENN
ncbi:hypothetical protein Fcan01_10134 [Folsomia candida]|uniref:Uncharacterized protein n=1 Tax=Folsomia candida TaxID=158441 RepID=A0A226E8B3_FOLCA|nr:hypothetical protein Fcan01_10134 [Folsomia candida]